MSTTAKDKERVRRMLREAFADVERPEWHKEFEENKPVSHEQCVEFRTFLPHLPPEDRQYFLPRVLEDLLDTHTGDDVETEGAEFVLMELNGSDDKNIGFEYIYARFTHEQAQAICEWLRLARTWSDLNLFTKYVDSAHSYWCRRASE